MDSNTPKIHQWESVKMNSYAHTIQPVGTSDILQK